MPNLGNFEAEAKKRYEQARAAGNARVEQSTLYGGSQGMVDNPAFGEWTRKKAGLEAALVSAAAAAQMGTAFGGQPNPQAQQRVADLQAQISALGAPPPRQIPNQLAQDVGAVRDQGASAVKTIQQDVRAIERSGDQAFQQGQQVSAAAGAQANAAQRRDGPDLQVGGVGQTMQQTAGNAAGAFSPNTSGIVGVRQAGTTGAANISAAGLAGSNVVSATGQQAARNIATAGATGADAVGGFRAATGGISALNKFAQGPAGPSAAEAMLRLQSARDRAAALSRARSARGGAGAVAEAMKIAQAEGAATSADTRGQLSLLAANEAAANRAQSLQALTAAGGLEQQASGTNLQAVQGGADLGLRGATAAGQTAVGAEQAASETRLQAQTAAAGTHLQAQTAATSAELQGSAQALQGIQVRADIANSIRGMDIDEAKAQLGADLQTMGLNDEQTRFFAGLGEEARQRGIEARATAQAQGLSGDQAAAAVGLASAQQAWQMLTSEQQVELTRLGIEQGAISAADASSQARQQQQLGFLGTILMAGATVKSDRRAKRDIRQLKSMAAALRKTPGSSYRYKSERDGKGRFTGPMAQDLESTPEFRGAIVERGGKKTVDTGRLVMTHHAALSDLQRQIDRLERLGRKKPATEERA